MARKASKKVKGPGKIAGKQIRKQVRSLKGDVQDVKKGVAKEMDRASKRMATQTKDLKAEFAKLSDEMKTMKNKGAQPKRELSMYNLFVRKQIKQGKSFEDAVKLWKSSRKMIENPELAKTKPKTRTKTVTKTKVVVRKVPHVVVKHVPKVVVRKVPMYEPGMNANSSTETRESLNKVMRELNALKTEMSSMDQEAKLMPKPVKHVPSLMASANSELPIEEVAVRLTRLYFEEIARLGFKRRLDFDAIINAYYYCLQRLENKDKELEVMRKLVEREENKITHESKAQLFPEMRD